MTVLSDIKKQIKRRKLPRRNIKDKLNFTKAYKQLLRCPKELCAQPKDRNALVLQKLWHYNQCSYATGHRFQANTPKDVLKNSMLNLKTEMPSCCRNYESSFNLVRQALIDSKLILQKTNLTSNYLINSSKWQNPQHFSD